VALRAALIEGEASGRTEIFDFEAFLAAKRRDWQSTTTARDDGSGS
jgi:Arc/MetJ-type ribon-helix-helix transcriptional regulator